MIPLGDLRLSLAEAKIALRDAEQHETTARAIAETEAIDAAGGKYGSNDVDRKRFLVLAVATHDDYQHALEVLNEYKAMVDRLSAEIAALEDERAAQRLAMQERQASALERFANALGRVPPSVAAAATGIDEWYTR